MLKFWKKKPADNGAGENEDATDQAPAQPVALETPSPVDAPVAVGANVCPAAFLRVAFHRCSPAIPSSMTTCWMNWKLH
jgi:hypothetical protein